LMCPWRHLEEQVEAMATEAQKRPQVRLRGKLWS